MFPQPDTLAGLAVLQCESREVQDKVNLPTCHVTWCLFLNADDTHAQLLGCSKQHSKREGREVKDRGSTKLRCSVDTK